MLKRAKCVQTATTNIFPKLLDGEHETRAWLAIYWQHRAVFHAFNYSMSIYQDVLDNRILRSIQRDALLHKGEAIRILNDMLLAVDQFGIDLEVVILVVQCLATHNDLDHNSMASRAGNAFKPHSPSAKCVGVYGRVHAAEAHHNAQKILVDRAGGLANIRLPGLANVIAR